MDDWYNFFGSHEAKRPFLNNSNSSNGDRSSELPSCTGEGIRKWPGQRSGWATCEDAGCSGAAHRRCRVSACAPRSSRGGSGLSDLSSLAWEAGPLAVEGRPGLGAGVVIHSLRLWAVPGQRVDPARAAPWRSPVTVLQVADERRAGSLWVALSSEYSTKTPLVHVTPFKSFLLVWYYIDTMKFTVLTIIKCRVQWR